MRKLLMTLAALGGSLSAYGVLDLEFTIPEDRTFPLDEGASGILYGTISGVTTDVTSATAMPLGGFTIAYTPEFESYLALTTDADYSGSIATITAGTVHGAYYGWITLADGGPLTDGENLLVQVTPEPTGVAVLGMGLVALLRRRRKA